jgi:hypothetical protein
MRGVVYGGHAPVVGAHVYVLQPGTSGYGSPATSLLGSVIVNGTSVPVTSASGYAITENVNDPNVPGGAKYETTDSSGAINLTGGYTCTAGQPVYLYAYGTSASTVTKTPTTSTKVTLNLTALGSGVSEVGNSGVYQYTLNATIPVETPLVAGHTVVTLAGLTGVTGSSRHWQDLDSPPTYTVVSVSPNFTSFVLEGTVDPTGPLQSGTATYTYTTYTTPTTNPELELATLGVCPSSGNFSTAGNGALTYVFMNEVSTVATAYTFQPFTLASNNNAWDIGSSGTTQALVGIANAADTAAQLYDIQGATLISATNDGEGHLANYQTLLGGVPNQGNGVVPQATIDSLANILAACIDSTPASGDVLAAQCTTLFNTATDNGETIASGDTAPTDTATAAINIARYPAGNNSGTTDPTYAADLFGIPTGTVPYAPDLAKAPNDWTIAINYPLNGVPGAEGAANTTLGKAESIAVDNIGQIWITAQTKFDVVRWSPLGVQNASNYGSYIYGYISIDGANNAWAGNAASTSGIEEFNSNGVLTNTWGSGYNKAYTVVANDAGTAGNSSDAYFFANTLGTGSNYEMFEYGPGGTPLTQYNISPSVITAGDNVAHGAIDSAGDLWLTTESSYQIARVSSTGVKAFTPIVTNQQPEFPSIDSSGNAWIAVQATTSQIYKVTPTGGSTILTSGTTGAELTSTFGSAVDGNGNVWFVNRCGNYGACGSTAGENSLIELNGTGTTTPGTVNTAISPSTNYIPETDYNGTLTTILDGSLNLAIDPSGNIWITNYTGGSVAEIVGAAAPVETPLSVAAANSKLGAKP